MSRLIGKLQTYLNILNVKGVSDEVRNFISSDVKHVDKLLKVGYKESFLNSDWVYVQDLLKEIRFELAQHSSKETQNEDHTVSG